MADKPILFSGPMIAAFTMYRTGKKAAGRLLDGREWNGVPG